MKYHQFYESVIPPLRENALKANAPRPSQIRNRTGAMRSLRKIAKSRRGVPFGIIHEIGVRNLTVWPDHDPDPGWLFLIGVFSGAISDSDEFIGIAQKFAWKANFLAPFLQIFRRAESDPQNDGLFIGKFMGSSTEPIGLLCSIIAERAWIEPQHDVFASMIR